MSQRTRFIPLVCLILAALWLGRPARAAPTPPPPRVTLAGNIQALLGCPGDWQPECPETALTFDPVHQLWLATFELPAGDYEYKAALNGTWDENYGAGAEPGGANIPLSLEQNTAVTFLYDHNTHWIADTVNFILANVPGSFNSEIGCPDTARDDSGNPGDWAPDCLQTWLQDPDGDGVYQFVTTRLPAGNYEAKVAVNLSWDENYGDGGAPGGANIGFAVARDGAEVAFMWDSRSKILTINAAGAPKGNLTEAKAYWVAANTILTPLAPDLSYTLYADAAAGLTIGETGLSGGQAFPLTVEAGPVAPAIAQKFPHLASLTVLQLPPEAVAQAATLVRGQVALGVVDAAGNPVEATGLQIPGLLDDLYVYTGPLGVAWEGEVPTLRLWAPTAQTVRLHHFADADGEALEILPLTRDDATGVWSISGAADWANHYYLYEVTVYAPSEGQIVTNLVTDPYSHSLSMNSTRTQIIDWRDAALAPAGWETLTKPPLAAPEDIVLYELHVRDFSIFDDSVPAEQRGTYLAFTHADSRGMMHLRQLAQAGLTHIHLLPVFDIATINEDRDAQRNPLPTYLATFPPDAEQQQATIYNLRDEDGFNWGYDPLHYTTPEGSYATDPNGAGRVVAFRAMVQALNQTGLRVVMDVVYNHTNASGQAEKSVLDRIVPGYYHRLNSRGRVENSTCCANTATEHAMMRKLMIDSLLTWAREYRVDGFRFDLMGHHMVEDMLAVRAALDSLTLEQDGVDGRAIYVYGEGWNFGEVANDARGRNATQLNLPGSGIGTFNDRLRDAARGGNPFGGLQEQGFVTGLYTDPNGTAQGEAAEQLARLLHFSDQIRVGLAGNLADYTFPSATGVLVRGAEVDYNGSPAGYTQDPQENIVYVEAHDNQTFFDIIQYKAPLTTPLTERVRMQNLGIDLTMLAQGVPFFHAGIDMLRSKSMDRDSFNSGDWFNRLDFTYTTNNWGVGLPVADKNEAEWPLIGPLLANPDLRPTSEHILSAVNHFQEMLQVRRSSPLFRLPTAQEVQARLRFHNTGPEQLPGLIVMELDDTVGASLDPNYDRVVVVFNATPQTQSYTVASLAGATLTLHPVLANSADPVVRTATAAQGALTVPGRTTAVFVEAWGPPPAPPPRPRHSRGNGSPTYALAGSGGRSGDAGCSGRRLLSALPSRLKEEGRCYPLPGCSH